MKNRRSVFADVEAGTVEKFIGTAYDDIKAIADNIDTILALAGDYVNYVSAYDANTNSPDLDTSPSGITEGAMYEVSAAGTFFTATVEVGDVLIAKQDDPTAESHWIIIQANVDPAQYATAAQGALADSALQAADIGVSVAPQSHNHTLSQITDYSDLQGVTIISGTTHTVVAADNTKELIFTNAGAIAVTLPDGLAVGTAFTVKQAGAGVPTVTPSGSDTLNGAGAGLAPSAQWAALHFLKYDTGVWFVTGV